MQDNESGASKNATTNKQVDSLLGKVLRVYRTGDRLTMDFNPQRINIEVSEDNRIISISEG